MQNWNRSWWWWTRGALAIGLAVLLVGVALPSAGRLVVNGPSAHAVWGTRECLAPIALAMFSLVCIFVGMWKRWAFEILGWAILVVFILASGMG
jgi:hypothetical protein